jgi:N-acylneuraminate cytidylyltransferase
LNIAVIPARGGSQRIPRKNIRDFMGKPIIAHVIANALESALFDRVIVSTDDEEIAAVARRHGAAVPFMRPPELADEHTGTTAVLAHAVSSLLGAGADDLAAVCCIYPTAALLHTDDLRAGLQLLQSGEWQYVFSATTFSAPVQRSFHRNEDGSLRMLFPEEFATRSQDLPDVLHDAGQFYWGRPDAWSNELKIFAGHSTVVQLPRWRVQDIDTEEDWTRAEFIAAQLHGAAQG